MAYVVDLIVIMRAVFQDSCENEDGIIQSQRVEEIIDNYHKSATKKKIHDSIRGFVEHQFPCWRSTVVEKIESMIEQGRTENADTLQDVELPPLVFESFEFNPQAE